MDNTERKPVGFVQKQESKDLNIGKDMPAEKFPLIVSMELVQLGDTKEKFYRVYNSDGQPVSGTPRTKEEMLEIARTFIELIQNS